MHRRCGLDLAAQGIERDELPSRNLFPRKPAKTGEQRLACGLEVVHRPGRGRRRIVDLVGEAGRELAQGDQELALPRGRLDGTRGLVKPRDEVPAEREQRADPLTQHAGRHPQEPAEGRHPGGSQVYTVLVPGLESARPPTRDVHLPDHGVLAANAPY
jgi:hypothetical protein